jgi:diguanylate cyclase (GGDEF)-like protein
VSRVGPSTSGPGRLLLLVVPVTAAGGATVAAAAWSLAVHPLTLGALAGAFALLLASAFAEAFPVPVLGVDAGGVSLGVVFVVGSALLYGWAIGTTVGALTVFIIELVQRRQPIRLLYNGSVYAMSAAAAGGAAVLVRTGGADTRLVLGAISATAAFYAVNVALTTAVAARATGVSFRPLLRHAARLTIVTFGIMGSSTVMLIVVWERSPFFVAALVGPLLAVVLYQRSANRAVEAMQLALTDPATGLGNRRHFHERLQRDLDRADLEGTPVSVCLLDVDDFKHVNDTYGHLAGDRVLVQIGNCLRHGGEAFRLGGDEFALLLAGHDEAGAIRIAEAVLERTAAHVWEDGVVPTLSAGVAGYTGDGDRTSLLRRADEALYAAKRLGKSRVATPAAA